MAMIKCHECGREISDTANACPGCGAPVRKPGCVVHFERPRAILSGTALSGIVYIDGQRAGSAATGAAFEVYLSYGEHNVAIESSNGFARSSAETLNIPFGSKKVIVTIKPKSDALGLFGVPAKLEIVNVEVVR